MLAHLVRSSHLKTPLTPFTERQLLGLDCVMPDSFVEISFDNAKLVSSNLGGQGGRCANYCWKDGSRCFNWYDQCEVEQPTQDASVPPVLASNNEYSRRGNMDVMFRTLGFQFNGDASSENDGWEEIWMSINVD